MVFPLPTRPAYLIAVYAAVGTSLLILLLGLLYVFCSKRYRFNWWERSLLEQLKASRGSSDTSTTAATGAYSAIPTGAAHSISGGDRGGDNNNKDYYHRRYTGSTTSSGAAAAAARRFTQPTAGSYGGRGSRSSSSSCGGVSGVSERGNSGIGGGGGGGGGGSGVGGSSVVRICCSSRRRLGSEDSSEEEEEDVTTGSHYSSAGSGASSSGKFSSKSRNGGGVGAGSGGGGGGVLVSGGGGVGAGGGSSSISNSRVAVTVSPPVVVIRTEPASDYLYPDRSAKSSPPHDKDHQHVKQYRSVSVSTYPPLSPFYPYNNKTNKSGVSVGGSNAAFKSSQLFPSKEDDHHHHQQQQPARCGSVTVQKDFSSLDVFKKQSSLPDPCRGDLSPSPSSAYSSDSSFRKHSSASESCREFLSSGASDPFRKHSSASDTYREFLSSSSAAEAVRKHSSVSDTYRDFLSSSSAAEAVRKHSSVSDTYRDPSSTTSLLGGSAASDLFRKHSSVSDTFPAHRVFFASESSKELLSSDTSLRRESYNSYSSLGSSSLSVPYASFRFPVPTFSPPATSPAATTSATPPLAAEPKTGDLKDWLKFLAAKCMAGVAGRGLLGRSATTTSAGAGAGGGGGGGGSGHSRGAEWLQSVRKMGSSPSSPVADASEKFWVPPAVLERKRAQSLVPDLSRQGSDDGGDVGSSSGAGTPASIAPLRELSFSFSNEKVPGQSLSNDGLPSTPPAGYVPRRRASMHDAIDYTKIDARLYDKKQLVRQDSVKSIEEENLGSLNFSLEHNPETNILTVHLIQARNLVPRDFSGTADPYVRVSLLPDQRSASAQSRTHRKTVNPVFEEEFIFELKDSRMEKAVLEILVYDYDQFSRDECIGFVKTPLRCLDLSEKVELWKGILPYEKDKDRDRDIGDVMFSLSYLPSAERLTVVVVKARNLRHPETSKECLDPYVKVAVMAGNKKTKKKKTATWHSTNNPMWNEALVFNFAKEHLDTISLEVSVFHDNKLGNDERLGKVRLSSDSSGEEKAHWQDLVREKSASARWHKLT